MKRSVRHPKASFARKRGGTVDLSSGRRTMNVRQVVSIASMIGAALLLIYGMTQPVQQDSRWILSLWLSAPLLLLAIRFSLPKAPHGAARSIQNLAIVVAVGFALLSFELLRQQFVRSNEIYNFIYTDDQTGQSTSNVRPIINAERVRRGQIVDSTGRVLASSHVTNGFATRTYPIAQEFDPTYFGNVLGYFSSRFGQSGLELTYSDYLSGEHDVWSRWQDWMLGNPQVGSDLHLTLSAPLQAAAGQILAGRTGSIVVLNPKTGAVLAMASGPNFDPRGLASNNDAEDSAADNSRVGAYWSEITSDASGQPLINRPVQGRYPPGSTYKTVTAIGALENPQLGRPDDIDCPNERYTDEGAPPVVNAVNDLFMRTGNPSNLEHVYAFSCNTAFAEYAMRLGQEKEVEIAERFDIYRPQDMPDSYSGFTDLPTRASQIYVDPGFLNTKAAVADTGYGQGQLLVTPLQMAMVAAAVANEGVMMRPYLVDHITRPDGSTIYSQGPSSIRRVMSSETAAKMRVNMRAGVEYGFGKAAQQVDPSVALVGGKSGTAENVPGATPHAWFIAIAPVDNPRYAVAVMIENGGEGSSVGARAAGEVLAAAFSLEQ